MEQFTEPTKPQADCHDLVEALERLYKTVQALAFYFVPRDVMKEVIEASEQAEKTLKKYKS